MLNIRLESEQETYLDNFIDNKSEYVRGLIQEDLESEERDVKAFLECEENFMRFYSEYTQDIGIESVRRYDEEIGYYFDNGKNVFVNKGRQLGITSIFSLCALWHAVFNPDRRVVMMSFSLNKARNLTKRVVKEYRAVSPVGMMPDISTHHSSYNVEFENGSSVKAESGDYEVMKDLEEGDLLIIDEMGHISSLGPLPEQPQVLVSSTGIAKNHNNYETMLEMTKPGGNFEYLEIPTMTSTSRNEDWFQKTEDLSEGEGIPDEHKAVREVRD